MKRILVGLAVFSLLASPGALSAAVEGGAQASPAPAVGAGDVLINTTEAHLRRKVAQLERQLDNVERKLKRLHDKVDRYH